MSDSGSVPETALWQKKVWFGAGVGLLGTIIILLMVVGIVVWRTLDIIGLQANNDHLFTFFSIELITTTLIRLLAVLIGAAIAFSGLAISFFVHEKETKFGGVVNTPGTPIINTEATMAKATLATYSPGIIGMVVGAIIIACALFAKAEHQYQTPAQYKISTTSKSAKQSPDVKNEIKLTDDPMPHSSTLFGTSVSEPNH